MAGKYLRTELTSLNQVIIEQAESETYSSRMNLSVTQEDIQKVQSARQLDVQTDQKPQVIENKENLKYVSQMLVEQRQSPKLTPTIPSQLPKTTFNVYADFQSLLGGSGNGAGGMNAMSPNGSSEYKKLGNSDSATIGQEDWKQMYELKCEELEKTKVQMARKYDQHIKAILSNVKEKFDERIINLTRDLIMSQNDLKQTQTIISILQNKHQAELNQMKMEIEALRSYQDMSNQNSADNDNLMARVQTSSFIDIIEQSGHQNLYNCNNSNYANNTDLQNNSYSEKNIDRGGDEDQDQSSYYKQSTNNSQLINNNCQNRDQRVNQYSFSFSANLGLNSNGNVAQTDGKQVQQRQKEVTVPENLDESQRTLKPNSSGNQDLKPLSVILSKSNEQTDLTNSNWKKEKNPYGYQSNTDYSKIHLSRKKSPGTEKISNLNNNSQIFSTKLDTLNDINVNINKKGGTLPVKGEQHIKIVKVNKNFNNKDLNNSLYNDSAMVSPQNNQDFQRNLSEEKRKRDQNGMSLTQEIDLRSSKFQEDQKQNSLHNQQLQSRSSNGFSQNGNSSPHQNFRPNKDIVSPKNNDNLQKNAQLNSSQDGQNQ